MGPVGRRPGHSGEPTSGATQPGGAATGVTQSERAETTAPKGSQNGEKPVVGAVITDTVRTPVPPSLASAAVRAVTGTEVTPEGPTNTVPVATRARF